MRTHTVFYAAGACVAAFDAPADRLIILLAGNVSVYLQGRTVHLLTIGPGCVSAPRARARAGVRARACIGEREQREGGWVRRKRVGGWGALRGKTAHRLTVMWGDPDPAFQLQRG